MPTAKGTTQQVGDILVKECVPVVEDKPLHLQIHSECSFTTRSLRQWMIHKEMQLCNCCRHKTPLHKSRVADLALKETQTQVAVLSHLPWAILPASSREENYSWKNNTEDAEY